MRNKPSPTEFVRDAALNDDMGIHRALVLVQRLNHVYGSDTATKKALGELADILIGVQDRQRQIHQLAERLYEEDRQRRFADTPELYQQLM